MNLNRTGSVWNRNERVKINDNWDTIEALLGALNNLVVDNVINENQLSKIMEKMNGLIKKGELSVNDININLGKIGMEHLSETVLEAIAGTAPVSAVVADGSLTTNKFADNSVTEEKASFVKVSSNLLNNANSTDGYVLTDSNELSENVTYYVTDFIEVDPSTKYFTKNVNRWLLYDSEKNYISGQSNTTSEFTTHANTKYARFNVLIANKDTAQLNKDSLKSYEPYFKYIETPSKNVMDNSVKTTSIEDKSVTKDKIEFINSSSNLVDESKLYRGYAMIANSKGVMTPNATNNSAVLVPVEPDTDYSIYVAESTRVFMFDTNKNFIVERFFTQTPATFRTTPQTRYVSFNVHNNFLGKAQLSKGTTLIPYEKYFSDKTDKVYAEGFEDVAVKSANLIDERLITYGHALDSSGAGTLYEQVSNNTTSFIEIDGSTVYEIDVAQSTRVAFYDKNKNFISYFTEVSDAPVTFTTPANAKYLRATIHRNYLGRAYLTKGVLKRKILPYGHHIRLDQTYSTPKVVTEYYDAPTMPSMTEDDEVYLKNLTPTDYYQMYDSLMAEFPEYIKKTFLGNDANGNAINKYEFKPASVDYVKNEYPRILIHTGTHGSEKMPMWTVYKFFELLCKEWSSHEILEALRFQAHFVVIPVVCPYGVLNHTRKNHNGVDLVRNYPTSWEAGTTDPSASTYRGTHALSEVEAVLAYRVYKEYDYWNYVVDFHNFSTNEDPNKNFWVAGTSKYTSQLGQMFMRKITAKLSKKHEFVDENKALGWVDINVAGIYWLAKNDGYHATLFETRETLDIANGQMYDSLAMTWSVEAWTNWIYHAFKNTQ